MHRVCAVVLMAASFAAQGCASWHPVTPATDPDDLIGHQVRGTYRGQPVLVKVVEQRGTVVRAQVDGDEGPPRDVYLDLRTIDRPEAEYRDTTQQVSLGVGAGFAGAVGLALLSAVAVGLFALADGGFSTGAGMR